MSAPHISVARERIAAFCQRNHIRQLAFFGSVLRDDFRPDSDVDVLVEFEAGHSVGFFDLARMAREMTEVLGRKADLRTPAEISPYFRDEVLRSSLVEYAAG
jgi:hypothetical protein